MVQLLIYITVLFSSVCFAQSETEVIGTVKKLDSEFWTSYNTCDTNKIKSYIANDIEFYHDKGGITLGQENLINSIKNNLCSKSNYKIRREVLTNSEKYFILKNNNAIYGVILTGEHKFYLTLDNKKEFADGIAKFTHLWLFENNIWKMKRILSYDHQPIN